MSEWIETKIGKSCGDVDFNEVEPVAGAITPVPGGVGPMTTAMRYERCCYSFKKEIRKIKMEPGQTFCLPMLKF